MTSAVVPLESFIDLPAHARLLGLDLGSKTIGLALSDVERQIASPLETYERQDAESDAAHYKSLVACEQIVAIANRMLERESNVLVTRIDDETFQLVKLYLPDAVFHEAAGAMTVTRHEVERVGLVAVERDRARSDERERRAGPGGRTRLIPSVPSLSARHGVGAGEPVVRSSVRPAHRRRPGRRPKSGRYPRPRGRPCPDRRRRRGSCARRPSAAPPPGYLR